MKFGTVVAARARRVPERVAVACGAERLTFGELNARSDRPANALLGRGLRSGDRVVLYLGNVIERCRSLIAGYKKPRDVRFVESLPRNSVGKVVKESLRAGGTPRS